METPIKMDDLGAPLFSETSICKFPGVYCFFLPGKLAPRKQDFPLKDVKDVFREFLDMYPMDF